MHRLEINPAGAALFGLKTPGWHYLDDYNTGELLMLRAGSTAQHVPLPVPRWDPPPRRLLIIRAGGFGDLIFLSAVLAEIHRLHPETELHVATNKAYQPVLQHLPFPVTLASYPFPAAAWSDWQAPGSAVASLEHIVEDQPDVHPCQSFAAACGLNGLTKPAPVFQLTTQEEQAAHLRFPRLDGEKRLGIQLKATAKIRSYPADLLGQVMALALQQDWRIFIFGAHGDAPDPPRPSRQLVNLTSLNPELSFRQSCAVLPTCDVILAPDSALCHAAGAMGLPVVALYGPFSWKTRTSVFPSVRNLQGTAKCAPCNHHVRGGFEFPKTGHKGRKAECQETGFCTAMNMLDPERVMHAVNSLLKQ